MPSKVKVTEVMRLKGYSDLEAADLTLQMQVHRTIKKFLFALRQRPPTCC
jgi:hypothetical protein